MQRNYNVNKMIFKHRNTKKHIRKLHFKQIFICFLRVSMFTYYFIYIVISLHAFLCFYVYILFCLHCNFFISFFRVSMFTYHLEYVVFFRVYMRNKQIKKSQCKQNNMHKHGNTEKNNVKKLQCKQNDM
jgi:predicted membrane protein